jgi:hypothetical protein
MHSVQADAATTPYLTYLALSSFQRENKTTCFAEMCGGFASGEFDVHVCL